MFASPVWPVEDNTVRLLYVGPTTTSAVEGVRQGLKEANVLGSFTGHVYQLTEINAVEDLVSQISSLRPVAVLAVLNSEMLTTLNDHSKRLSVIIFNLTTGDDALRQQCPSNLLHIGPSDRMRRDAVNQWRKVSNSVNVIALAWHAAFKKFAARELNNRFHRTSGTVMNDASWAGWAAVKIISEAVARTDSTTPGDILVFLKNQIEFDGQKGLPHTFRDTGQLQQPLLLVEHGELVGEAPVRGVVETDNLESLGLASCKK